VEVPLLPPAEPDPSLSFVVRRKQRSSRRITSVALGFPVDGVALPRPDLGDSSSAREGVQHRFGRKPPRACRRLLRGLRRFTLKWCKENLTPISPDYDLSFETWLHMTPYSETRKAELRTKYQRHLKMGGLSKVKINRCKSFIKDEAYVDWKHFRAINSRSDEFKCLVGPLCKAMENEIFKHPAFIKKVPIAERPVYIMKHLARLGGKVVATDYTSFEALFSCDIMSSCEFTAYEYLTSKNRIAEAVMSNMLKDAMLGTNVCDFKDFTAYVEAKRMSGEMLTSLGNGITNLLVFLYLAKKCGCTNVVGVVEGDDGLFTMRGAPPTAAMFEKLGLIIKLEVWDALEHASFCGIVFDPDDLINVCDVRKAVANFGWTSSTYVNARNSTLRHLLRAKSYSMIYQFPGCPVLQALGAAGLRLTSDLSLKKSIQIASRNCSEYERTARYGDGSIPILRTPGIKTRLLVEKLYGVTIEQQLYTERYLDQVEHVGPLPVTFEYPEVWKDYWKQYSCTVTFSMEAPMLWPKRRDYAVTAPVLLLGQTG
jgi:hypothetical protein